MFTFSVHSTLKRLHKLFENILQAGHNNFRIFIDNGVSK